MSEIDHARAMKAAKEILDDRVVNSVEVVIECDAGRAFKIVEAYVDLIERVLPKLRGIHVDDCASHGGLPCDNPDQCGKFERDALIDSVIGKDVR